MGKVLYLGTDIEHFSSKLEVIHYPVIRIQERGLEQLEIYEAFLKLPQFTHILCTSKHTVQILCRYAKEIFSDPYPFLHRKCLAIGNVTQEHLRRRGIEPLWKSQEERQEGILPFLEKISLDAYVFYPRSSKARLLLQRYLQQKKIACEVLDLYHTTLQKIEPVPSLEEVEEIMFTSPSTVEGFFQIFSEIPPGKKISFQGKVTRDFFQQKIDRLQKIRIF